MIASCRHLSENGAIVFFTAEENPIVFTRPVFLTLLSVDGHLTSFPILVSVTSPVINMNVWEYLKNADAESWVCSQEWDSWALQRLSPQLSEAPPR